jgi:hypothetical protein
MAFPRHNVMARLPYLLCLCLGAMTTGCMHTQLRNNSVNEAMTVGDLQTQQVMNNLAMFVYNYNSMPYFAYPNQGSAIITDQVSGGATAAWGRPITSGATAPFKPAHFGDFLLNAMGLSANAQRASQESFTLTPINDPRKLELMRCAYQIAVSNCGYGTPPRSCPDCQARLNTFYTGDVDGKISQMTSGTITSDCLKGPCWFHVGCEKEVPDCPCILVGHYCGVYVWVLQDGRNELTKLTLAILDYATHDAPQRLTKDVTYYVDALGLPTDQKSGVGTIKATMAINEQSDSLLNLPAAQEVDLEQQLQDRVKRLTAQLEDKSTDAATKKNLNDDIEDAKRKLYFLDQQLKNGGMKEQFAPAGSAAVPPYSIIPGLQQELNAHTAPATLPSPQ